LDKLAATKFEFTDYSFNDIVQSTEKRMLQIVREAGGKASDLEVMIPRQTPKAAKLEQSRFGVPVQVLGPKDPSWQWLGTWVATKDARTSSGYGQEVILHFRGTGIAIVGDCTQDGGKADVYLDGKKQEFAADARIPERTYDNDLWHRNDLFPGEHTLKLVTLADSDSKGAKISISKAVVYQR